MLTMEKLDGPNQYACDSCGKKADALKGIMIRKYPPILTLSLSRFDFDLEKLQRVKINSKFAFGVELDVSMFAEKPENYSTEDERIYELCAVIIHRGDAFGGHYKAYIRDVLNEGDWGEKKNNQVNGVAVNREHGEEEKKNGEMVDGSQQLSPEEQKMLEDIANKDTTDDESPKKNANKPGKKNKKNKKKKNRNKNPNSNQQHHQEKKDKTQRKESDDKLDDTIYDKVEFPFKFKNEELKFHWFDFDDSTVRPIPHNRIQYQFGGTMENAYILIYRQRALGKSLDGIETKVPKYLQKDIDERNQMLENERNFYNEALSNIECLLIDPSYIDVKLFKS